MNIIGIIIFNELVFSVSQRIGDRERDNRGDAIGSWTCYFYHFTYACIDTPILLVGIAFAFFFFDYYYVLFLVSRIISLLAIFFVVFMCKSFYFSFESHE